MNKLSKKPSYSDAFRATAIAALVSEGWPENEYAMERVAQAIDVPGRTLRRWANGESHPPPDDLVTEKKADMGVLIETEIYAILELMPEKRTRASYSQLAIVLGTLFDKLRLLRNLPTEIVGIMPEFVEAAKRNDLDPLAIMRDAINEMDRVDA